ncbi:MAG: class I SAM-dependent methyltransferase [Spirosomataceae bacterium]
MSNLYKNLAPVYEAMYETFMDYDNELKFYSQILRKYHRSSVFEIGSGAGSLAKRFIEAGFDYAGIDISSEMIALARKNLPHVSFHKADMRHFELKTPAEAMMMVGRTISYLLTNDDVMAMFRSVHNALPKGGIFCFDAIDASRFIPTIRKDQMLVHDATHGGKSYRRESYFNLNLSTGWTWDWRANYFELEAGEKKHIGDDFSTLRAFTEDDIHLFSTLNNLKVLEIIAKPSYAFDTLVYVVTRG